MPLKFFKSTGFKTAALASLLFGLTAIMMMVVLYFALSKELTAPAKIEIENQSAEMAAAWTGVPTAAFDDFAKRLTVSQADRSTVLRDEVFYAVFSNEGQMIAGSAVLPEGFNGWRNWTETNLREGQNADLADSFPVLALGVPVTGGTLVTGHRLFGLGEAQEAFTRVLAFGGVATVLLSLMLGWLLGHHSSRRIDAILGQTIRFSEGELSARLPLSAAGDDIDQLASTVNLMMKRSADTMAAMQRVSSGIAHELKTPLTRLRHRLETLQGSKTLSRASLAGVISDTDNLIAIFNALLRIAQIEQGARREKFETVNLCNVAAETIALHEPAASAKAIKLKMEGADHLEILGDRRLLQQLLSNLIDNALNHAPKNSIVTVSLVQHKSGCLLSICDEGPGIDEAAWGHVLEPFYRLERDHALQGTGLGLATANAIAELHNAKIGFRKFDAGFAVEVTFQ